MISAGISDHASVPALLHGLAMELSTYMVAVEPTFLLTQSLEEAELVVGRHLPLGKIESVAAEGEVA